MCSAYIHVYIYIYIYIHIYVIVILGGGFRQNAKVEDVAGTLRGGF